MGALDTSASLTAKGRGWGGGMGGGVVYSNEFSIITIIDQINTPKRLKKSEHERPVEMGTCQAQ